jgi:hypothetical protein
MNLNCKTRRILTDGKYQFVAGIVWIGGVSVVETAKGVVDETYMRLSVWKRLGYEQERVHERVWSKG